MTHREFLDMVTPDDVKGYAAFSNKQGMTVAATSLALQWALQKAIQKFTEAKQEREREAAKREVEQALAELRRARRAAGLPRQIVPAPPLLFCRPSPGRVIPSN